MPRDCRSARGSHLADNGSILGGDRLGIYVRKHFSRCQILFSDLPESKSHILHSFSCLLAGLVAWADWRRHTWCTVRSHGKPKRKSGNRVTIACTGVAGRPFFQLNITRRDRGDANRSPTGIAGYNSGDSCFIGAAIVNTKNLEESCHRRPVACFCLCRWAFVPQYSFRRLASFDPCLTLPRPRLIQTIQLDLDGGPCSLSQ
jgi:hypothetical protein